jgi:hypothetical protein
MQYPGMPADFDETLQELIALGVADPRHSIGVLQK